MSRIEYLMTRIGLHTSNNRAIDRLLRRLSGNTTLMNNKARVMTAGRPTGRSHTLTTITDMRRLPLGNLLPAVPAGGRVGDESGWVETVRGCVEVLVAPGSS